MCPNTTITQTAGFGAQSNTFVAEQHNHVGLSILDATQIAFEIFHQYYPKLQDEALRELRKMVEDELQRQSPKEIVSPSPRIAVPALRGASITEEDNVRRLYANLLASAMNKDLKENVHPSFSKIIDQMSSFDAILMKQIADISNSIPVAQIKFTFDSQYLVHAMPHYYSPNFDLFNDNWAVSFSIENLSRLKLINLFEGSITSFNYDNFKTFPFVIERFEYSKARNQNRDLKIDVTNHVIQLNDFGREFIRFCMP